jgi:hypothetical protein
LILRRSKQGGSFLFGTGRIILSRCGRCEYRSLTFPRLGVVSISLKCRGRAGALKCTAPVLTIPSPVTCSSEEEEDLEHDMEEEQEEKKEASRKRKRA